MVALSLFGAKFIFTSIKKHAYQPYQNKAAIFKHDQIIVGSEREGYGRFSSVSVTIP